MGTRIHKAIGWGLTGEQFAENIGFEIVDDDLEETLCDKLDAIKTLTVPERSVVKIFEEWRGFIAQPNLLAKNFYFDDSKPVDHIDSASDLYIPVANFDEPPTLHLFLPSAIHLHLHRRDNTLDYVEATHDLLLGAFVDDPASFHTVELKQNPYPWNSQFMNAETGEQVSDPYYGSKKSNLVPQPPPEIRWWLTETGIIKPDAWKLLRPYYAMWWI